MPRKSDSQVCKEIAELLSENNSLTVPELAAETQVKEAQITKVLDAYTPDGKKVGTGRGGGWLGEVEEVE